MKTLLKDTFREIKNSFGRFISIFLIISLGVGFFAGIKATAPDMKYTADRHFSKYNLMDFWVLSSFGFNDEDLEAFKEIDAIDKIMPSYSMDALMEIEDEDRVIKLISLDKEDEAQLNRPILKKGRLPEKEGECNLEATEYLMGKYDIGSKIKLKSGRDEGLDEDLKNQEFTVVGFSNSPLYITPERGASSIGNGKVFSFVIVDKNEFKSDYYTDLYLGIKDEMDSFSQSYKDHLEDIRIDIEDLAEERRQARYDEIRDELDEKLHDGREELSRERSKGEKELDDGRKSLEKARKELDRGERLYREGESKLQQEVNEGRKKISDEKELLDQGLKEYRSSNEEFQASKPYIEEKIQQAKVDLETSEKEILELETMIEDFKKELEVLEDEEAIGEGEARLLAMEEEARLAREALDVGKKEVDESLAQLQAGEKELLLAKSQLDEGSKKLDQARIDLDSKASQARIKLDSERRRMDQAKLEIIEAEKEYKDGLEEFNKEISKGERDLVKLEREIKKLEKPDWYIIKRDQTRDYIEYEMGADRIDSVAKVFPLFFFLIALLVCLTTMARMVDEQRSYIGSLKALGYGNMAIMSKYLIYALIASLLGSIFGLLVGFKVFPTVIFNAYRIMFIMPEIETGFNSYYALTSSLAAVITTSLAAFLAVRTELKETTAELMRPKAPKIGKRILLERIDPIWSRMKFSQKVTARNIFRYKRRLFMTIIGIAGCTALLLAGFGLKDSIMGISSNQFDEIYDYQMNIDINDGIIDRNRDPVIKFLQEDDRVESFILSHEKIIDVEANGIEKELNLVVVEEDKSLNNYIKLRNRESGEDLVLDDSSIILTEKMALLLKVKEGDWINLRIKDKDYPVKISGITENYAYHYAYMKEGLYEELLGEELEFNRILVRNQASDKKFEDGLSEDLLDVDDVSSILFITGLSKSLNDTMGSLNYVIVVLIVTAGGLAFVVLYNLTNINISERMREIATIKVLGFYDREVSRYVYRENNILTLLGTGLGLVLGILLHKFIILTVEIEMIMFGREIRPESFLYSALLTIVFSQLVNYVMHFSLKKIDMVESLKSVD